MTIDRIAVPQHNQAPNNNNNNNFITRTAHRRAKYRNHSSHFQATMDFAVSKRRSARSQGEKKRSIYYEGDSDDDSQLLEDAYVEPASRREASRAASQRSRRSAHQAQRRYREPETEEEEEESLPLQDAFGAVVGAINRGSRTSQRNIGQGTRRAANKKRPRYSELSTDDESDENADEADTSHIVPHSRTSRAKTHRSKVLSSRHGSESEDELQIVQPVARVAE